MSDLHTNPAGKQAELSKHCDGPEPDPRDLMKPFPSDLMTMWPIDSKVGSPRNNTPDIIDRIGLGPTDLFDL